MKTNFNRNEILVKHKISKKEGQDYREVLHNAYYTYFTQKR